MARSSLGWSLLALTMSGPALVHPQVQDTPVPASMLAGRTLNARHLGFSIEAPDATWRWTHTPNPDRFYCSRPDGKERFAVFVLVLDEPRPVNQVVANGYIDGFAEPQAKRGFKLEKKACTPLLGEAAVFRCSLYGRTADQTVVQYVAYIRSKATRFYSISYTGIGTTEPPEFKTFAKSFKPSE